MSQSRNSLVLAACLIAPAASALLRKIVPGQPSSLEIMGVLVVLAGGVWVLRQPLRPPAWLLTPLLVWAYFRGPRRA